MEEKRIRRSIIFPESLYEKAKKQADKEFRQISGLVVIAVEKYLEEKEKGRK
jgi:metal-responsive CopG/Arc/MetJ family transcriptional regulator